MAMNSSNRSCNSLFGADYPTDSTVEYNWTKFQGGRLKRILADAISGRHAYHLEAQMGKDNYTLSKQTFFMECNSEKCYNKYRKVSTYNKKCANVKSIPNISGILYKRRCL